MNYFEWNKHNEIDFEKIEKELGFVVHNDLKEFYLKFDKRNINCIFNGINWFEDSDSLFVELISIDNNPEKDICNNFNQEAIYGNDKNNEDIRYHLGYLIDDRGYMGLYFNNKSGKIDFCDYEYGADSWNECPRAIISKSLKDFISLLK